MFAYKVILKVFTLLSLTSCGFHPLYKENSSEVKSHLGSIKIQTIPNREGQILHNQLSALLTPLGAPRHPLYALSTSIIFANRGVAIQKDESTSQEAIDLTFDIQLTDFKTGKLLYTAQETSSTDYVVSFSFPYSNIMEERNGKKRLLEQAAENIQLHLASFFQNK